MIRAVKRVPVTDTERSQSTIEPWNVVERRREGLKAPPFG